MNSYDDVVNQLNTLIRVAQLHNDTELVVHAETCLSVLGRVRDSIHRRHKVEYILKTFKKNINDTIPHIHPECKDILSNIVGPSTINDNVLYYD